MTRMSALSLFCVLAYLTVTNCFLLDTLLNHIPHQVCYGELGCFSNGSPFLSITHRPLSVAPQSPAVIGTRFLLYTRENPTLERILDPSYVPSISESLFVGSRPTKIIVHGFTHNAHRPWILNMTKELLTEGDYNVITVDWHKGAILPYETATANTRVVGAQIAQLIKVIMQLQHSTSDQFHIIGHSLGAHVAGYAGERISHLGRISGLDPASPYFENTDIRVRLDPSDADFIDVIHTDGGGAKNLGFGSTQAMGHVDFYPNGGKEQPGCPTDAVDKLGSTLWTALSTKFDYYASEESVSCSHERSYYYYTESINSPCPFTAYSCPSADVFHTGHCIKCSKDSRNGCSRMGFHADKFDARGNLYLETESVASFCDHHYVINISATNSFDGKLIVTLNGDKGSSSPQQLMSSNEAHLSNDIVSKMFSTRVDVGNITSLTVHYEKIAVPLISTYYPDDWRLNGIAVFNGDTQKRSTFCAYHKEIDNHNTTQFAVRGHCY